MKRHFWPNSNVGFAIDVGVVHGVVEGWQMPHPCPSSHGLQWLDIRAPLEPRCGKALQPPPGRACASRVSAFHLPAKTADVPRRRTKDGHETSTLREVTLINCRQGIVFDYVI